MISFFFKNHPSGWIRGQQMAERLGARMNPAEGYENDICIWVKQQPPDLFPKRSYVDIVDGEGLLPWIENHPDIGVIACSKLAQAYLTERLQKPVYLIQQHHCNYERTQRTPREVSIVGYIGTSGGLQFHLDTLRERLAEIGLNFTAFNTYRTRADVVRFYQGIDIQIAYRPRMGFEHAKLKNPLKLANAGSFGIPSVMPSEENYVKEWEDCFVEANSLDEMVDKCNLLKKFPGIYSDISNRAWLRSQQYHINEIAKQYEQLYD